MKLLTRTSLYGVKALLYLAEYQSNDYIPINQLSINLDIPFHYLTKILQSLNKDGLIETKKGLKGGVKLHKSPCEIKLSDIIGAVENKHLINKQLDFENKSKYQKLDYLLKYGNKDNLKSIYETTLDSLL